MTLLRKRQKQQLQLQLQLPVIIVSLFFISVFLFSANVQIVIPPDADVDVKTIQSTKEMTNKRQNDQFSSNTKKIYDNDSDNGNDKIVAASTETSTATTSSTTTRTQKPNLVFHVGPPKTATTAIQETLTAWDAQGILMRDDQYLYTGAFLIHEEYQQTSPLLFHINRRLKDTNCHRQMSDARLEHDKTNNIHNNNNTTNSTTTIHDVVAAVPCARDILQALQPYADNRTNLLISDETLSMRFQSYSGLPLPSSLDWLSLKELLGPVWNITVIVAYRRYCHWLPSAKQQMERWTPAKPKLNAWPADTNNGRGKKIEHLFPNYWKRVTPGRGQMSYHFTDGVLESIQQVNDLGDYPIRVAIHNLHALLSPENNDTIPLLRTNFMCNVLPSAPNLCEYSRQLDRNQTTDEPRRANPSQQIPIAYDQLVSDAAIVGYINTTLYKRHATGIAARKYHEILLSSSSSSSSQQLPPNETESMNTTTTPLLLDLPLSCPSQYELEEYLNVSLQYEKELFPHFYSTKAGKELHVQEFWDSVNQSKYCSVDTQKAMEQEHWQAFFRQELARFN